MKKTLCILSICAVIAACGGGNNSESSDNTTTEQPAETAPQTETAETPAADQTASEGSDKGKELIAQSDCLTCHKEHDKLVGPAYAEVAKKYTAADIDHLVTKIIEGGKGVWGEIPMTPHPSLSKEDAEEMVKYILSIK